MANTFSQLHIQIVFSVKHRDYCIPPQHREEVHRYISAIAKDYRQKILAIFCMPDHIHLLIGLRPEMALSEFVRKVKTESSKFINSKGWVVGKFQWQSGYGAFSYSKGDVSRVINYIRNQEVHHKAKDFKTVYVEFLEKFEVDYDEQYLFDMK